MGTLWGLFVLSPFLAWSVWAQSYPKDPGSLPVAWWALIVLWVVTLTHASTWTWWMSFGMFVLPWALARTNRLYPGESAMKLLEVSPLMTPAVKWTTGAVGAGACLVRWM